MSDRVFTHTAPDLLPTLAELTAREPIFHRATYPTQMAADYWEVGASGRRYSHDFIVRMFEDEPPVDTETAGWQTSGHQLRRLAPDTFLLTYTLLQSDRHTRRATLWQLTPSGWQVLYHQGTLITADTGEDDTAPAPPPSRANVRS